MKPMTTVDATYLFANGMAMTFDAAGEQIPELQGPADQHLYEAIRDHSTPTTRWVGWDADGPVLWKPL